MVDDCIKAGKSVQEGGAVYNFTGPQGFGIANNTDGLIAIKQLVFDEKLVTMQEFKDALEKAKTEISETDLEEYEKDCVQEISKYHQK